MHDSGSCDSGFKSQRPDLGVIINMEKDQKLGIKGKIVACYDPKFGGRGESPEEFLEKVEEIREKHPDAQVVRLGNGNICYYPWQNLLQKNKLSKQHKLQHKLPLRTGLIHLFWPKS